MKNSMRISALVSVGLVSILGLASVASAQSMPTTSPSVFENAITVHGIGLVEVMPDTAVVTFNVESKAPNAKDSLDTSNQKAANLVKAFTDKGIAANDVNVTTIYMYSEPYYGDAKGYNGMSGSSSTGSFYANQSLSAVVKTDDMVANVIESVITAGATRIDSVDMSSRTISFSIEADSTTAKGTLSAINAKVDKVKAALTGMGVNQKDITTTYYTFYPDSGMPVAKNFTTTRTVVLKVHDLNTLDTMVDLGVSSGADSVNNISYALEKSKSLQRKARAAAIADAREKAMDLADLTDALLGKVKNVSSSFGSMYPTPYYMGMGGGSETVSVNDKLTTPGMIQVMVELDVTFNVTSK